MLLASLKSQLQRHGLWAKKGLGQHFLVEEEAFDLILEAAELSLQDSVVEVGAGTGLLTTRLAPRCASVTALEYDRALIPLLQENLARFSNVDVRCEDALKFSIKSSSSTADLQQLRIKNYKLVANIPYYITSPLIKHFLMGETPPKLIVLLTQKEVAEKICGQTGKTVLTTEIEVFGQPEIVAIVPKICFYPPPKVDSAILRIRVYDQPLVDAKSLPDFLKVLHAGFSQKRKMLANSLGATLRREPLDIRGILQKLGIDQDIRAEKLGVQEWLKLTKRLI